MKCDIKILFKSDKAAEPLLIEDVDSIRFVNDTTNHTNAYNPDAMYELLNKKSGPILIRAEDKSCTFVNLEDVAYLSYTNKRSF